MKLLVKHFDKLRRLWDHLYFSVITKIDQDARYLYYLKLLYDNLNSKILVFLDIHIQGTFKFGLRWMFLNHSLEIDWVYLLLELFWRLNCMATGSHRLLQKMHFLVFCPYHRSFSESRKSSFKTFIWDQLEKLVNNKNSHIPDKCFESSACSWRLGRIPPLTHRTYRVLFSAP